MNSLSELAPWNRPENKTGSVLRCNFHNNFTAEYAYAFINYKVFVHTYVISFWVKQLICLHCTSNDDVPVL